MMDEPRLIEGGISVDDRGTVRYVNGFDFAGVKRFYVLQNHQVGYVRAWHGHKTEAKWVTVTHGAAVVCAVPIADMYELEREGDGFSKPRLFRCVMTAAKPQVLYIPPGYANGHMALVPETQVMHFSSLTMEEAAGDDIRWPATFYCEPFDVEAR